MKRVFLTMVFGYLPFYLFSQTYIGSSNSIRRTDDFNKYFNSISEFRNCVEVVAKVSFNNEENFIWYICFDTVRKQNVFIAAKRTLDCDEYSYEFLDAFTPSFSSSVRLRMREGSVANDNPALDADFCPGDEFCIGLEKAPTKNIFPHSAPIIQAWVFNLITRKFREISSKCLYREAEGYYYETEDPYPNDER